MTLAAALSAIRRLGRWIAVAVWFLRGGRLSVAIAVSVGLVALAILPVRLGGRTAAQIWQVPGDASPLTVGSELPVFCVPRDGSATRCGIALVTAPTRIAFTPYGAGADPARTIPVLAASDMGLLWALGDAGGKLQVRASATALVRQLATNMRDLTQSPLWRREYRDATQDMLERVAMRAWNASDTQRALSDLIVAAEPVVRQSIGQDIGPVIGSYMTEALWRVVKSNTTQVFSLIGGRALDLSPLGVAVSAALRDPAIQPALGRLGPKLLALPQTELLTERFVANLADAAQRDPEIFAVLSRVATDPRLGQGVGSVRAHAGVFLREVGQVMWGVGNNQSLNALAGMALKTTISGGSRPLILMLDPESGAALEQEMPGGVTLLSQAARS